MKLATLLFTFDDPDLAGLADVLDEQVAKEAAVQQFEWQRKFIPVATVSSSSAAGGAGQLDGSEDGHGVVGAVAVSGHRDALYKTLQDLFSIPKDTIMVISLMSGRCKEDYVQVREICQHTSPPIYFQIVPYVSGLKGDTALMVRNIVRCVSAFATGRIPGESAGTNL
jgi:hypothetical protein